MQLAAQRIALNLHDAGFNVQIVASTGARSADLALRRLTAGVESAAGRTGGDAARRGSSSPGARTNPCRSLSRGTRFSGNPYADSVALSLARLRDQWPSSRSAPERGRNSATGRRSLWRTRNEPAAKASVAALAHRCDCRCGCGVDRAGAHPAGLRAARPAGDGALCQPVRARIPAPFRRSGRGGGPPGRNRARAKSWLFRWRNPATRRSM